MKKNILLFSSILILGGCASAPPENPHDICDIFSEKRDWYFAAKDAQEKWGAPKQVLMSMMFQESSFKHNAQPPMDYFLGFIPIGRKSSAYGYSQAKTPTWQDYIKESDNSGADRDELYSKSSTLSYKRGTYKKKQWLMNTATKVKHRASNYAAQLKKCEAELDKGWFMRLFT